LALGWTALAYRDGQRRASNALPSPLAGEGVIPADE